VNVQALSVALASGPGYNVAGAQKLRLGNAGQGAAAVPVLVCTENLIRVDEVRIA